MNDINQFDPNFMEFLFTGLDHGIDTIKEGSTMIPFVITWTDGERKLIRFVADTFEESFKNATDHLRSLKPIPDYALLAYDGQVTIEEKKFDAIIVQAHNKNLVDCPVFAQRYIPKTEDCAFRAIGNAAFIGTEKNCLHTQEDEPDDQEDPEIRKIPWWKIWKNRSE